MRDVIGPALGGIASGQPPQHQHERGVEERHDQDQARRERPGSTNASPRAEHRDERGRRQHRADEEAPAVAHEQARRRPVPEQESEERAGERRQQDDHRRAELGPEQVGEEAGGDERHAGGQAVHVVEQVEGVADAGKPDDGDERYAAAARGVRLGAGQREDEEGADGQRRDELGERRELQSIVEDADDEHGQRGGQDGRPTATGRPRSTGAQRTTRNPAIVAAAIAIPPIVGVGARCQRSGRGGTTAPMAGAKRRTTAPSASEAAVAITKASAVSTGYRLTPSHNYRLTRDRSRGPSIEVRKLAVGSWEFLRSHQFRLARGRSGCRARTASGRGCRRRSYPAR